MLRKLIIITLFSIMVVLSQQPSYAQVSDTSGTSGASDETASSMPSVLVRPDRIPPNHPGLVDPENPQKGRYEIVDGPPPPIRVPGVYRVLDRKTGKTANYGTQSHGGTVSFHRV